MKINKKTILISWFIGLGSGLFISGIILTILLYTSNKNTPILGDNKEESQTVRQEQKPEITDMIQSNETLITQEDDNGQEIQATPKEKEDNIKNINTKTIEINIEPTATARDIARMLVKHGVIPDYDEFIAYVTLMGAERSLFHGNIVFPLNSDVETVFKILRP